VNILVASSEAVPFCKTGGLGDVCGSLPSELARRGHRVALILPAYRQIHEAGLTISPTGATLEIPIGGKTVRGRLLESRLPGGDVPVYFVDQPSYFDRPELYRENGKDYHDNCERFVFFSRAVIEAVRLLDLSTDLIHCNDWQTGLVPAYLKIEYKGLPVYDQMASLFTIHNLAYQGNFWHWDMVLTGLDWKYFNWRQMEFYEQLSFMKTGLIFADGLSTVSPRYAEEIQTASLGCGMEGVLSHRSKVLSGIVNGVDYEQWNPRTDSSLARNYDASSVVEGKAECKAALQAELGLQARPEAPLFAIIGRLSAQKGFDLVAEAIGEWVQSSPAQWAILGTGDPEYHELVARLASRYPGKVAARLEFSEALAHRMQAGADMLLMPSRYEPCGLNQLYALKYGTAPVVRATGGLADTIVDATAETLASGTATGFAFQEYATLAFTEALRRATAMFADQDAWRKLVLTGMRQDWSWSHSAAEYSHTYERTVARIRQSVYH
jgi:starch synthase